MPCRERGIAVFFLGEILKKVSYFCRAGLVGLAFVMRAVTPALAGQSGPARVVNNAAQETVTITPFEDGLRRNKYLVQTEGSRNYWYADGGSKNAGPGESGRETNQQDWCRVRYLYGDDVRIPACWDHFMYSSHLITGLDGTHYELWFSPSSLSYYKIRNQETGLWYAHDGSKNDGRVYTTKDDWCRIIFFHMNGIVKRPKECDAFAAAQVNAIAGNSGPEAQRQVLAYVKSMMGEEPKYNARGEQSELAGRAENSALGLISMASEEGFSEAISQLAPGGRIEKLDFHRTSGFLANKSAPGTPTVKLRAAGAVSGIVVGAAVDYGIDKIKDEAGLRAQDANAGWIAAETVSTTVASTAISTAIMTACGASFNPVVAGVGFVVAGGVAAGQEIAKASEDTGIQFEDNYGSQLRYNRDLNGISDRIFAQNNPEGTFFWEPCAAEGERCEFVGLRSVRYGTAKLSTDGQQMLADKIVDGAFVNGVDCTNAALGKDPAPGVVKKCYVGALNWDRRATYFVKDHLNPTIWFQIDSGRYCVVPNMDVMNAYGGTGQVRVVHKVELKGQNEGICPLPNGLYIVHGSPAIYYLTGEDKTGRGGLERQVGNRLCEFPDMQRFNEVGVDMSMVQGISDRADIFRSRKSMGACAPGQWVGATNNLSASDVGDRWAITRTPQNGNFTIVRMDSYAQNWEYIPGEAVRIGGSHDQAWVSQANGKVYRWTKSGWEHLPGKLAKDVGDGWIISDEATGGGYRIYYYDDMSKSWVEAGGAAVRIGGTRTDPWVVTSSNDVFQWVNGGWQMRPGIKAFDVGQGWALATSASNGSVVYKWNEKDKRWDWKPGGPHVAIGGTQEYPAIINQQREGHAVYSWR